MGHFESMKKSRWTKTQDKYIRICVRSTHVYINAGQRDEILDYLLFFLLTYFFFRKGKAKDANVISRARIHRDFSYIDPRVRVLNYIFKNCNKSNHHHLGVANLKLEFYFLSPALRGPPCNVGNFLICRSYCFFGTSPGFGGKKYEVRTPNLHPPKSW